MMLIVCCVIVVRLLVMFFGCMTFAMLVLVGWNESRGQFSCNR